MKKNLSLVLVLILGVVLGVALSSWRAFPTEDMIARASCAECHDVHAAVEWKDAPFQSQIWILGDVPTADYVIVSDLFPYAQQEPGSSVSLRELLAQHGVNAFQRVAIESLDGGIVILDDEYVTEDALLVPYLEGVRFTDRNQHESTWLKGVRWIVVEGPETPLRIAGRETSMGRLLLADRTTLIADHGDARFKSPYDGKLYQGDYAHVYTGARLSALLQNQGDWSRVRVIDAEGKAVSYERAKVEGAIIATFRGKPALVLPETGRGEWVQDLEEIVIEA